jgi:2-hydroxychromene-2-carboxylate isomerase
MSKVAMFAGLVVDENGKAAQVAQVGQNACYVVMDDDFKRHIDAEGVDRQVLRFFREQVDANRDMAVNAALDQMGTKDIFAKAAVEASIDNMEQSVGNPIPEDARMMLGMFGFRIVIDMHGNVVDIKMPAGNTDEDDL